VAAASQIFCPRSRPYTTKIGRGPTGNDFKRLATHRVLNSSTVRGKREEDFYIEKTMLLKIVAFKPTISKFLKMLEVHNEGKRHPLICLFNTLFSCQCPFKDAFLDGKIWLGVDY
jgi:hypothetical protein